MKIEIPRAESTDACRKIIADYTQPDALCVAYWHFDIKETIVALSREASRHVGVILITPDPAGARDFVDGEANPTHFGIVAGTLDSPWIRDRAPISVRLDGKIGGVLPNRSDADRPLDAELFTNILADPMEQVQVYLPAGNLVPGPAGLAVSTSAILTENGIADPSALDTTARQLGVAEWLFVPPFEDDKCAHADGMVRFLAPDLCAIAERQDRETDVSRTLVTAVTNATPQMEILPLPCAAGENGFDSLLNWVQIGQTLLMPDFGNPDPHFAEVRRRLEAHGFEVIPIPTATAGLGGALRCLTASIFVT